MTSQPFRVERLNAAHDRAAFDCGVVELNTYLATRASQDEKRRVASCFIALETATSKIAVYYTLSAASVDLSDTPAAVAKKLPRYPAVPAIRLGGLAVSIAARAAGAWRRAVVGRDGARRESGDLRGCASGLCEGQGRRRLLRPSRLYGFRRSTLAALSTVQKRLRARQSRANPRAHRSGVAERIADGPE